MIAVWARRMMLSTESSGPSNMPNHTHLQELVALTWYANLVRISCKVSHISGKWAALETEQPALALAA